MLWRNDDNDIDGEMSQNSFFAHEILLSRYGDCAGTFWFETGDLGLGYCNR